MQKFNGGILMISKNGDERIISEKHKFGYQAFNIVFTLFLIDIFIKAIVLNRPITEWIDIFIIILIGCFYFTFKSYKAGVLAILKSKKNLKIVKKRLLIQSGISAVIFTIINVIADFTSKGTIIIPENIISGLGFFVLFYFILYFTIIISDKKANKMIDDDK